jgi:hypothetical protein
MRSRKTQFTIKRERDFQTAIVETLQALKPQKPTLFKRALATANSPLFLVIVGLIVSFFVFYRQTYVQCVSDSRKLYSEYIGLKFELLQRENDVLAAIFNAKSIADLRKTLDPKKSYDPKYKDDTLSGLQVRYASASEFIDESGINKSADLALRNSEPYQKYSQLFSSGIVLSTMVDSDLPPLKQLALLAGQAQMIDFITDIRSEAEIQCIRPNVLMIMWGETPVTIQRFDVGSFTGKERLRLQAMKGRNLLEPRKAPAPFPQTDFKPPEAAPAER